MNRREFIGLSLAGGALSLFDNSAFAAALSAGGRPKTLVLGGGAFALGYALAHPKEALVLERGIHLGLDYAGTTGPVSPGTPTTEIGRELVAKMAEAQILKNGVMELPPLATSRTRKPVTTRAIKSYKTRFHLITGLFALYLTINWSLSS